MESLSDKIRVVCQEEDSPEEIDVIEVKYVKEFIKEEDNIIMQEINKTDGSVGFDLNNLFQRICIRRNKLAGDKLI